MRTSSGGSCSCTSSMAALIYSCAPARSGGLRVLYRSAMQQHRNRLRGRRARTVGKAFQRHQRIGLGIVAADAAAWNVVLDQQESIGATFNAVVPDTHQIDPLAVLQAQHVQILLVDEH